VTGTNGSSGSSGINGTAGSGGTSGTSGIDGTAGSGGTSGTSGLTGTSGTSGVGTDGTSGTSGQTALAFPYTGSAQITGSLSITGSLTIQSGSFSSSVVTNLGDVYTDVAEARKIVTLTSASYAALSPKDPNTLYVVSGSSAVLASQFPYTGSAIISGSIIVTGSAQGNVVSASIASSTASIDANAGNFFTCLVTASTFFNVINITAGETVSILLTTVQGNGNAALPTASFSTNVLQPSGSRYTPSSGSGAKDVLSLVAFDGTNAMLVAAKKFI